MTLNKISELIIFVKTSGYKIVRITEKIFNNYLYDAEKSIDR